MRFGIKLLTFGISAVVGATIDYFISNKMATYVAPAAPAAIPTTTPEAQSESAITVETVDC